MSNAVKDFMAGVVTKDPEQKEFHQAVEEVVESLVPVMDRHPEFRKAKIVERIVGHRRLSRARRFRRALCSGRLERCGGGSALGSSLSRTGACTLAFGG